MSYDDTQVPKELEFAFTDIPNFITQRGAIHALHDRDSVWAGAKAAAHAIKPYYTSLASGEYNPREAKLWAHDGVIARYFILQERHEIEGSLNEYDYFAGAMQLLTILAMHYGLDEWGLTPHHWIVYLMSGRSIAQITKRELISTYVESNLPKVYFSKEATNG